MKNYSIHVGVDISKLKLDIIILKVDDINRTEHLIIDNKTKSIKKLISLLKKKYPLEKILFCCENTGVYTYPLSDYCTANGIDCWVVAALEIKRSMGIRRGKNDKTDAREIALYSCRHIDKIKLATENEKENQELRQLYSEREKIVKSIKLFKSTKENEGFVKEDAFKSTKQINQKILRDLRGRLLSIDKYIEKIIKSNEKINTQFKLIQSVPGIGKQTAIYLIIVTKSFTCFENARQLACYAGIAPFENSSGSSLNGRTRVSHIADKKMKSLLHMCSMTAIRFDYQLKEYYQKKKEEGKPSLVVLNNIKNKMIGRVFAVINRQTPYVNTYKFGC